MKLVGETFNSMLKWIEFMKKRKEQSTKITSKDHSADVFKTPREIFESKHKNKIKDQVFNTEEFSGEESDYEQVQMDQIHAVTNQDGSKTYFQRRRSGYRPFRPRTPFTTTSTTSNPSTVAQVDMKKCPRCPATHLLTSCSAFSTDTSAAKYSLVRNNKLCYHCLRPNHVVRGCTINKDQKCGKNDCQRYHHRLLHPQTKDSIQVFLEDIDSDTELFEDENTPVINLLADAGFCSTKTVTCYITCPFKTFRIVVLIDSGANTSAIDKNLADYLCLEYTRKPFVKTLKVMDREISIETGKVEFQLLTNDGSTLHSLDAWTVKDLSHDQAVVDWNVCKNNFDYLRCVPFDSLPEDKTISILIGTDYPYYHGSNDMISGPTTKHPVAVNTPFGWSIMGTSSSNSLTKLRSTVNQFAVTDEEETNGRCATSPRDMSPNQRSNL